MTQRKNEPYTLTTAELATLCGVVPEPLRIRCRKHGHWRGLVPRRSPKGSGYLWPARSLELLAERARTVKPGRPPGDRTVREL